ncbi:Maf-like protein [Neocallimastix californiae]|jgi:septum formation protein|uniref:Maf-like protein n=1 Tax=Neocallimastix californiae TaxID=1754190 RepID=A0A1Y2BYB1_9FUNG|nr:Maf-like protein [Neocallimastix californiae]|eukprot:ORY39748.1 Maf-like protein [Neocallimastix californiae]
MNLNLPFLNKFKNNKDEKSLLTLILGSGSPRRKEILSKLGIPFTVDPSKFDETILNKNNANVADYVRRNAIEKSLEVYCRRKKENIEKDKNIIVVGADTVVSCQNKILGKPNSIEDAKATLKNLRGQNHSVYTGVSILFPLKDSNIIKNEGKNAIFNLKKLISKSQKDSTHDSKKRKIKDNLLSIKIERLPFEKSYSKHSSFVTLQDISSLDKNTNIDDIIIISFVEETQVTFSSEEEAFSDEVIDAYVATREPMDKAGSYGYQGLSAFFIEKINGCYYNVVGFPAHRFFSTLKQLLN